MHRMGKYPDFVPVGAEQTFASPELHGDALFVCPMLQETGCMMGAEKPFDCKIWPFRMMQDTAGKARIAVASYCSGMKSYSDAQLCDFLSQGLAQEILAYAETHPSHIKPYSNQYRILL